MQILNTVSLGDQTGVKALKKQRLRRLLALCVLENLSRNKITVANVKRYVTSDLLASYGIRRETKISDQDRRVAVDMVHKAIRIKPIPFRFAPQSSPWGIAREKYFLETPLADLL